MALGEIWRKGDRFPGIYLGLVEVVAPSTGASGEVCSEAVERERPIGVSESVFGIEANGLGVTRNGSLHILSGLSFSVGLRGAQVRIECRWIPSPASLDFRRDTAKESDLEGAGHRIGDFRLQRQHIAEIPVIGLRPEVEACDRVIELRGDTNRVSRAPHAPLENCADVEFARDGADLDVLALEGEGRRAGRDLKLVNASEGVEYFLRQSIRKILLLLVAAHVHEREHGDGMRRRGEGSRGRAGRSGRWRRRRRLLLRGPELVDGEVSQATCDQHDDDRQHCGIVPP